MIRKKTPTTTTEPTSSDSDGVLTSELGLDKPARVIPELAAMIRGRSAVGDGHAEEIAYEEILSDLDAGDTITVTKGPELYGPIPYYNFTVGPFTATTKIRAGETDADAAIRVQVFLTKLFEASFEIEKKQFFERVGESGEGAPKKGR